MLTLMGHMSIVVSPWCSSIRQVSWRRLIFLEPRSIFNRVAPLPDGPAIYGPERGQPGNDWMRGVGETAAMTGWWMSVERDEGVHCGEVERDERELRGNLCLLARCLCFIDQLWQSEEHDVGCSDNRLTWISFETMVTGIHLFYLSKRTNSTLLHHVLKN